jgi:hypothetical protein
VFLFRVCFAFLFPVANNTRCQLVKFSTKEQRVFLHVQLCEQPLKVLINAS